MVLQQPRKLLKLDIAKHLKHQLPAPNLVQMWHEQQGMQYQVVPALLNLGDMQRAKLGQRHPRYVSNLQRSAFP
jgi:hypothetical protein